MMRYTPYLLVAMLLLAGCASTLEPERLASDDPRIGFLHWMTGPWISDAEDTPAARRVEETWSPGRGATMIGFTRTIAGGNTVAFEYMRIEATDAAVVFLASPSGRHPPTPFTMVAHDVNTATFENPESDFPQRIVYRREGDVLHARIEGTIDGQPRSAAWVYRRAVIDVE